MPDGPHIMPSLQVVEPDGIDHTKARPHPAEEMHAIQRLCPGWTARHHTLTGHFSARRGWVEVHGRTSLEVVDRVQGVRFA